MFIGRKNNLTDSSKIVVQCVFFLSKSNKSTPCKTPCFFLIYMNSFTIIFSRHLLILCHVVLSNLPLTLTIMLASVPTSLSSSSTLPARHASYTSFWTKNSDTWTYQYLQKYRYILMPKKPRNIKDFRNTKNLKACRKPEILSNAFRNSEEIVKFVSYLNLCLKHLYFFMIRYIQIKLKI